MTADQELAKAVIELAKSDLTHPQKRKRDSAQEFFYGENSHLDLWCSWLGTTPADIRRLLDKPFVPVVDLEQEDILDI